MFIFSYVTGERLENGSIIASKSKFDTKIEASSAKMYFHYYGQLLHQQNMLQDFVRTGVLPPKVVNSHSILFRSTEYHGSTLCTNIDKVVNILSLQEHTMLL